MKVPDFVDARPDDPISIIFDIVVPVDIKTVGFTFREDVDSLVVLAFNDILKLIKALRVSGYDLLVEIGFFKQVLAISLVLVLNQIDLQIGIIN